MSAIWKLALVGLTALGFLWQAIKSPSTLAFESILVINLAHRHDRRQRMQTLARALNLDLTFLDAVAADSPAVHHILSHVREERTREGWCGYEEGCTTYRRPPRPPKGSRLADEFRTHAKGFSQQSLYMPDAFFYAKEPQQAPLGLAGADLWPGQPIFSRHNLSTPLPIPALIGTTRSAVKRSRAQRRRRTATVYDYDTRPRFQTQPDYPLPWWRTVSPAAVACWHSHVLALKRFVRSGQQSTLILEDDVDLEIDLQHRLRSILAALPSEWDLVALGHCWSTEDAFPPVNTSVPTLRPADSPKCNHAYAVSRSGALRLLRHMRSPAFAYSRAFDQALVHLIVTDRIKAFSIVPSVAVQTKDTPSDIVGGTGSKWRDLLQHGVMRHLKRTPTVALL